ncbi:MAG: cytochrome c maturation protein CcmE [Pseudomonadota bacterium]|nr:cytochrome c maturation protein CcmE [Pseudomonadota bacterium]
MHPLRRQRLLLVVAGLVAAAVAVALALVALNENINLFYSPVQVAAGEAPAGRPFRVGGMVVENSVARSGDTLDVRFAVTDYEATVAVRYQGILPDLFREGQGVVATGQLSPEGEFVATEVLAKHDEKYMPPEVTAALEQSGAYQRANSQ